MSGAFVRVDGEEDEEREARRGWSKIWKVASIAAVLTLLALVGAVFRGVAKDGCSDLAALQQKASVEVDSAIQAATSKLLKMNKNQSVADDTVMKTMVKAGQDLRKKWEKHHVRKLDTLATIKALKKFRSGEKTRIAANAECSFNVLEAFASAVGMGDDLNAIIRTCPPPRDGESELACQVNGAILVAWVGNLATKLALAASNCALSTNVDAVCSAGVTGLVSAMGEIAAGASLGAATCTPTPPTLSTSKISVLGDQTKPPYRRLLIGEGTVGNGVQCGVDVGMVAANIANLGIAINKAVNVNKCKKSTFRTPLNVLKGIPEALCTVDIGGAVAYMSQVVTFVNLIVVHCQDLLDVNALCAGSIAAITTGAAAIAPYGAAVHAACRYNHLLKTPKAIQKINALYTVPSVDPVSARRLLKAEETPKLKESLAKISDMRHRLKELRKNVDVKEEGNTEADMQRLLSLIQADERPPRATWAFEEC